MQNRFADINKQQSVDWKNNALDTAQTKLYHLIIGFVIDSDAVVDKPSNRQADQ
jgi:hypothetical protein